MRSTLSPCLYHWSKRHPLAKTSVPQSTESTAASTQEEYTTPMVDIIENDNEFIILADMPGVTEEGVDINFRNGELTIFGEASENNDLEDVVFQCCQFEPGNYFRSFRIGESINSNAITADFNNGVLTVHLPKREEIQPRKISLNKNDNCAEKRGNHAGKNCNKNEDMA